MGYLLLNLFDFFVFANFHTNLNGFMQKFKIQIFKNLIRTVKQFQTLSSNSNAIIFYLRCPVRNMHHIFLSTSRNHVSY